MSKQKRASLKDCLAWTTSGTGHAYIVYRKGQDPQASMVASCTTRYACEALIAHPELLDCIEGLVYWHDQKNIDESWWTKARLLVADFAEKENR